MEPMSFGKVAVQNGKARSIAGPEYEALVSRFVQERFAPAPCLALFGALLLISFQSGKALRSFAEALVARADLPFKGLIGVPGYGLLLVVLVVFALAIPCGFVLFRLPRWLASLRSMRSLAAHWVEKANRARVDALAKNGVAFLRPEHVWVSPDDCRIERGAGFEGAAVIGPRTRISGLARFRSGAQIGSGVTIDGVCQAGEDVFLEAFVALRGPVVLGDRVRIELAELQDAVLKDDVRVGAGARIVRCTVCERAVIKDSVQMEGVTVEPDQVITEGSRLTGDAPA